ncbi:MAG: helix-turn-helix domain-containing protein [Roseburia hominis]
MIDNVTFGAFVRTLRKEKQMTQLELAKILNLSDKTISKWEQGGSLR